MNTFRVQCETCQSWLKVRDEGFLGEVHACPKCGSMVLIAQPGAAEPAEDAPTETEAPAAAVTLGLSDTLEADQAPPDQAPLDDGASQAAAPEPVDASEPAEPVEAPPAKPASWAPLVTTAASLVATGAIVLVWLFSGPEAPAPPLEAVAEPTAATDPETPAPDPAAPADLPTPPAEPAEQPQEAIAASTPTVEPSDEFELPAVEEPAEPTPRVALAPAPSVGAAPEPEPAEPPAEIDPLGFDPNEVELVLRHDDGGNETIADAPVPPDPTPAHPGDTPEEPTLDARLAAAAQHAGVSVRRGPTDASTGPAARPAQAALAYVLPSIALRDVPLDEAVRLLGDVAGAPITLDPLALRRAGVAATKPVDLVGEEQTLAALLAEALKQARLEAAIKGPHVTAVRQGVATQRTITHRLSDLAGADAEHLDALLHRLLPDLDADAAVRADGELPLTAPLGLHYDLLVLCERLRVARGLTPDTKYPPPLLAAEPPLKTLAPVLDRRTTFSFVEPTPLARVVDHWRRVTGLAILVDWRALADVGLGPNTTLACSVTNRPWRAALDGVLDGLGLAWAPAGTGALRVTTAAAINATPTTEFYPVAAADTPGLIARVRRLQPGAQAVYDAPAGAVLVRADAATHRALDSDGRPAGTPLAER